MCDNYERFSTPLNFIFFTKSHFNTSWFFTNLWVLAWYSLTQLWFELCQKGQTHFAMTHQFLECILNGYAPLPYKVLLSIRPRISTCPVCALLMLQLPWDWWQQNRNTTYCSCYLWCKIVTGTEDFQSFMQCVSVAPIASATTAMVERHSVASLVHACIQQRWVTTVELEGNIMCPDSQIFGSWCDAFKLHPFAIRLSCYGGEEQLNCVW